MEIDQREEEEGILVESFQLQKLQDSENQIKELSEELEEINEAKDYRYSPH